MGKEGETQARKVIVTNTTYQLAPWADVLFAMDSKWWKEYHRRVKKEFHGETATITADARMYGVNRIMNGKVPMQTFGNSGAGAIALAAMRGAAQVVLLGYDCQRTAGRAHWHPDHPKTLGNAGSLPRWVPQFSKLARSVQGVEIINCSRQTALTCWPCANLEAVL